MEKWKPNPFSAQLVDTQRYISSNLDTSQLKRTGNQSLCSFESIHMPVPFTVKLPLCAAVEVIVPHPSPLAPAPRSHLTRSGPPFTAPPCSAPHNSKGAIFHQLQCEWRPQELCNASMRTQLADRLGLRLTPQSHEQLAEFQSPLCPRHLEQCLVQSRTSV